MGSYNFLPKNMIKSSAPFRSFFDKSSKSSTLDFPGSTQFVGPFCVLRPKFRPLGNTDFNVGKPFQSLTNFHGNGLNCPNSSTGTLT
jgi:hypothetical protein